MIYTGRVMAQIGRFILFAMFVLIGIFTIEKFEFLLSTWLKYEIPLGRFALMFLSFLPAGAEYILPIAVLVATYTVLLTRRENMEFVVLATAGASQKTFAKLLAGLAFCAVMGSLVVTGYLKPEANYLFRTSLEAAKREAMILAPERGAFFPGEESTIFLKRGEAQGKHAIRIFNVEDGKLNFVFGSGCGSLETSGADLVVHQCNLHGLAFEEAKPPAASSCPECGFATAVHRASMYTGKSETRLLMDSLSRDPARRGSAEMPLHQLASNLVASGSSRLAYRLIQHAQRAFVAAFAVVLAIAAVAQTRPATRFVSLPLAIAAVSALSALAGSKVTILPRLTGAFDTVWHPLVFLLLTFVAGVIVLRFFGPQLIRPSLERR